jgi:sugar phosphate isomerase/epimerase
VVEHRVLLRHVHVASAGRFAPAAGEDAFDAFAANVRKAKFDGRLSIECSWNRFEDEAAAALSYLKTVFP